MPDQNHKNSRRAKKIHVTTLGCSKNTYDSEILMGQLSARQAELVADPDQAEVIIINTCGFIEAAKQESVQAILEAEALKKADPNKKVLVCGCLSARYKEQMQSEMPMIDGFFGTEDYDRILAALSYSRGGDSDYLYEQRQLSTPKHYAFLKIAEGCNHTCAFCAIPLMRGQHRSRTIESIVAEARQLAVQGVKELIIISQDTTFYGLDIYGKQRLVELLQQLEEIEGIEWIRLHYLYPTTVQNSLIDLMGENNKIVPYLDMPIQHISDNMLKIMKRGGNSRRIRQIFDRARERISDVVLRTTFIVGHPGETQEDFDTLKQALQTFEFDRVGVFTYSHEENTPAYKLEDSVSILEKEARYGALMSVQQEISLRKNQARIGNTMRVLIDDVDWASMTLFGRSTGDSPEIDNEVHVRAIDRVVNTGDFLNVLIEDATEYELHGTIKG